MTTSEKPGWRRWLLASAALALTAAPATVVRGDDGTTPATGAPLIIEVAPQTSVIIEDVGDLTVSGDAAEQVRVCGLMPDCLAFWQEGIGTVVIVGFTDIAAGPLPSDSTTD